MTPKVPASLNAKLVQYLTNFLPKTTTDVSVKDIQVHESKGYSSLIYAYFQEKFSSKGCKNSRVHDEGIQKRIFRQSTKRIFITQ